MTNKSSEKSYFDLHITGLGYLNRVREVTPKRGAPFLACDIAALTGPSDAVEYRRFDVKVSGSDAQHLIRRCEQAVKDGGKVLIGFKLGDLWVDQFKYKNGEKAGQTGVSLKARLLFVSWIKINGEEVYKAPPKANDNTAREEASETSSAVSQDAAASQPSTEDAEASAEASALAA